MGMVYIHVEVYRAVDQNLAWRTAGGLVVGHLIHIGQCRRGTQRLLDCSLVFYTPEMTSLLQSRSMDMTLCAHGESQAFQRRWRATCLVGTYEL